MPDITVSNPIWTLDGQELFPAGSIVNEDAILAAFEARRNPVFDTCSLLSRGPIEADILGFLTSRPDVQIFSDPESIRTVLSELGRTELPSPVLEALLFFKQNDFYTYRHFLMVFALSTLVAKELAVDEEEVLHLAATGPTHDIGKICVPLSILKKRTPLTLEEKETLNEHSVAGYVLTRYYSRDSDMLAPKVALEHHERRDGSGLPRGIPLSDTMVEIIAVCDIYDALISPRPYRDTSYDNRTALEELCKMAEDGKIGWDAVKVLIAHNRSSKPHYSEVFISDEKRGTPPADNHYGVISDD